MYLSLIVRQCLGLSPGTPGKSGVSIGVVRMRHSVLAGAGGAGLAVTLLEDADAARAHPGGLAVLVVPESRILGVLGRGGEAGGAGVGGVGGVVEVGDGLVAAGDAGSSHEGPG